MRWKNEPGEMEFPLAVEYTTSGYSDPGSTYGPPEYCSPPEGECEATLGRIVLAGVELPKELADKIFEYLAEAVEEKESGEPHGDDYPD